MTQIRKVNMSHNFSHINAITRPSSIALSGLDLATLGRCWRRYAARRIMRQQYHFRSSDEGLLSWDVFRLIELAKDLPVIEISLADISDVRRRILV